MLDADQVSLVKLDLLLPYPLDWSTRAALNIRLSLIGPSGCGTRPLMRQASLARLAGRLSDSIFAHKRKKAE